MKNFYITTPIYYINDVPHIGHSSTTLAADFIARLHRNLGDDVFFLTGTDEHGQKVDEAAQKAGLSPQEYCDSIAPRFSEAWKSLNISNDFFIRTTDPRHEKVVQDFLQKMYDNRDIYKDKYEGWYCIGCESFLTETDLVGGHCPLHPPEKTVWREEENWFFRLSKYVPKIIELIEDDKTNYVYPEGKRSEVLSKLKLGVKDISISRENVEWGIPVPWDKKHTIYVWIDALINYYSATQFLDDKGKYWPANIHLLAKEILWFHTVIWQAMLMSAGLDLPEKTFIHSFYIIDGQKMSKSLGDVISPQQLIDLFGVDGSRYLIARSFPTNNDSDVGIERFKERYNADLANNLGNLVSRLAKLAEGIVIEDVEVKIDNDFKFLVDNLNFDEAIRGVFAEFIDSSNAKLNSETPWKLEKDDPTRVALLKELIANIKRASSLLAPFMPNASKVIHECFSGQVRVPVKALFPRVI
ncbi:MAG: methionine--tRNA ligase [Patescibacteria group bacterium]|jgi:methionyl-tRNA synthetase